MASPKWEKANLSKSLSNAGEAISQRVINCSPLLGVGNPVAVLPPGDMRRGVSRGAAGEGGDASRADALVFGGFGYHRWV